MTIVTVEDLLRRLRRGRLLEPDQLQEVTRSSHHCPSEPRALARELVRRGWLTPYQVHQLFRGRERDLVLGSYVLLERLGEGGMGQVFKARHHKLGRIVALKIIHPERLGSPTGIRRFEKEIQAVARLSHPNIVHAYDADRDGATHFLVMEYVEGIDLARLVRQRGPLPVGLVCDCIRQAALGLQHVHANGLVHRDIKPHNLLLASGGPHQSGAPATGELVKVLDLGLALLNQPDGDDGTSSGLTRQGFVVGTVDYVAPEQAVDSHAVDIRADLYSLGCTFYHLLAGQVPFPGGEPLAKLLRHQSEEAVPIEQLRPDVPAGAAAVVRRLMAKRPEDRFQTPAEAALALTKLSEDGCCIEDTISLQKPRARRRHRPRRRLIVFAGACGLLLPGLLLLLFARRQDRETPPPHAAIPAQPQPRTEAPAPEITNSLGMKLVRIPAGEFLMGSPPDEPRRAPNEGPPRRITIPRPFYLGAHLVTVGDFHAFVAATGYRIDNPRCDWRNPGWEQTDAHPVACLSWHDAKVFCDWLSQKEDRVYRLPTEAEWEYACRAGSSTAYGFGDDSRRLGEHAWFSGNSGGRVHPVGRLKPNGWGLYDMHGSLWQWCADWYDPHWFGHRPGAEKQEPRPGTTRVQRGGSWQSEASDCRSARRIWDAPGSRRPDRGGFRVLLAPAEMEH